MIENKPPAVHDEPAQLPLSGSLEPSGQPPTSTSCPRCGFENAGDAASCAGCHRFLPGNTAAVTHGGRRSLEHPEALAAISGKREEVIEHLGGDPSIVQTDLATDYARLDTLIESVAANIEVGGVFTPKGHARAAVTMLLSLLDRRLRLAQTLGIERRVKQIDPLEAVRQAVIEANKK